MDLGFATETSNKWPMPDLPPTSDSDPVDDFDATTELRDIGSGAVVDGYKVLSTLGEGGFGVVYLAESQGPIRRRVALKVIKPGINSKPVIARFEAERQALALMDHPNIAKVLDAGTTEQGRPFFAMELVKGVPLTEYCDTHTVSLRKRLATRSSAISA